MEKITLKSVKREQTGKKYAKQLRNRKMVPGIVYGHGSEGLAIELISKDLETILKTGGAENAVIYLQIDGETKDPEKTVLIRDIQSHPVTDQLLHVDFNTVSLTEKIQVKVEVHEKGESPGVKEGGILDHIHRELDIECLPTQIPERIIINIEELKIGDVIHVKDIEFPEGVKCLLDPEESVLGVIVPKIVEETEPEEVAEEGGSEPELIRKENKEGEGEEAPAEDKGKKKEE